MAIISIHDFRVNLEQIETKCTLLQIETKCTLLPPSDNGTYLPEIPEWAELQGLTYLSGTGKNLYLNILGKLFNPHLQYGIWQKCENANISWAVARLLGGAPVQQRTKLYGVPIRVIPFV